MAGIGFELRKLYRKQGLFNNLKAYAYSTMTTIGPMILCFILVLVQQYFMKDAGITYLQKELFIATIAYCFIFSIIVSSGLSLVVTRFIADQIYKKIYSAIKNAYYGSLIIMLPIAALLAFFFLFNVNEPFFYKAVAYIFFVELVIIWIQNVFMSALKDYKRIFRSFFVATILSIIVSYLLYSFTTLSPVIVALLGMNVGFASILILNSYHFESVFPKTEDQHYFKFLSYIKRFPSLFINGMLVYSAVYIHTFVYWFLSDNHVLISDQFYLMPFYDIPVFYAYVSVLPSLIFFVVIIETDFFEKFVNYYKNVTDGGTYESLQLAKKNMRKVLLQRIVFLAEIQLVFTTLSVAAGLTLLPKIGFSMQQIDVFIILCFAYFFFILMFVLLHILMYFDDQKGILVLGMSFIFISVIFTYLTMVLEIDGVGMFFASFIGVCLVLLRILYLINNIDYYTFCPQPILSMNAKTQQKKRKKKSNSIVTTILIVCLLSGCIEEQGTQVNGSGILTSFKIDDKKVYTRDDDSSIKTLYVTVLPNKDNPDLDWYGLNQIEDRYNEDNFEIILAEGNPDGTGPIKGMFGSDADSPNAKISLRGNTARMYPQKSYKINLYDSVGTWNDQTVLNLNKHLFDSSRLRNKLSFDLMETIPNSSSLRTQFVQLYIKDLTIDSNEYVDYGLYTHVEQPNKRFLRNHLYDPNGYLYKVTFFEFERYPDQIKAHDEPTFDKSEFETILEIRGRNEHDKLIQMLEDVNNYDIPINDVINKHFHEDNLLTWVAINILMDNMDTDANNFFLYSPLNNEKWLILPWDYDDGWNVGRKDEYFHPYRSGISNFWGNFLFNRYFRQQSNVEKLTKKIEELYTDYINEETVTKQLEKYNYIPKKYIARTPDNEFLPIDASQYDQELQEIINTPKLALERYYEDLQNPKPFFQSDIAELVHDEHIFTWDSSFDFQANQLYYTAIVATDPAMENIVAQSEKIQETEFKVPQLPKGTYYLKVTVEDSDGNTAGSFDQHEDVNTARYYFGVIEVEVE
jgi:polysaccharide biosynthesis protein PelG